MGERKILNRAIFLDRDGVINRIILRNGKPYPPQNLEELEILSGVTKALERLHNAGFKLIVITNQPDVARGTQSREMVKTINKYLLSHLPIDEFRVCYHDDSDQCICRKPKAGALLQSADKFGIDLKNSYMIGDRWRDIEAGRCAGCKTIFIDYNYAETKHVECDYYASNLSEAADWIFKNKGKSNEKY